MKPQHFHGTKFSCNKVNTVPMTNFMR